MNKQQVSSTEVKLHVQLVAKRDAGKGWCALDPTDPKVKPVRLSTPERALAHVLRQIANELDAAQPAARPRPAASAKPPKAAP
jgi:hypothetical protein